VAQRTRSLEERRQALVERLARRAAVTDPDVIMEAAAAFLAVRPRSVAETRGRLTHLGYPPVLCDQVVERLVTLGYLDDVAFSRAWVESRDRARPRGSLALRQELLRKGVPRAIIDGALDERGSASRPVEDDGTGAAPATSLEAEVQAARRLLDRRAATLERESDPRRRRQKAYALLARHGFPPDVCRTLAASVAPPGDRDDEGV
jgi:regulatory protein